jgi:CelD/BcsL family acetyltransferase involved in cellulose biosynthesis
MECNGFLSERDWDERIGRCMFMHLALQEMDWDELVLDGLWHVPPWALPGVHAHSRINVHANHYIDLAAVRAHGGNYLVLLGPKTRARIRRSCREYGKFGEQRILAAGDDAEAAVFLDGLKALHQQYWVGRGHPGSFSNPFFEHFHRLLITSAFKRGEIQLLAIEAGSKRIGYIYNFVYRGRIYNYQSGFDYALCEKHNRPGLVSHARAIEFNARLGHGIYDFLGGDMEYKRSLGTAIGEISWMVLQRNRRRFKIEAVARRLRNRIQLARKAGKQSPAGDADS